MTGALATPGLEQPPRGVHVGRHRRQGLADFVSERHAHRAGLRVGRHARQFPLLLAQAQGGVLALRGDRAEQEPGDRKHQHEQLEDGEIGRVVADEGGDAASVSWIVTSASATPA